MKRGDRYQVRENLTVRRKNPFRAWLGTLDRQIKARVQARILRFESGNIGDCRHLGGDFYEARLHFGSGYRIYFGIDGGIKVILLSGGDKGSQARDIRESREYWIDYLRRR